MVRVMGCGKKAFWLVGKQEVKDCGKLVRVRDYGSLVWDWAGNLVMDCDGLVLESAGKLVKEKDCDTEVWELD